MNEAKQKERLSNLLKEMQGDWSLRQFARKLQINYASLSAYMIGDSFPETRNLEKIAAARGWTREEVEAYLDDRPVEPVKPLEEILKEIRVMSAPDAIRVAKEALDRIAEVTGVRDPDK